MNCSVCILGSHAIPLTAKMLPNNSKLIIIAIYYLSNAYNWMLLVTQKGVWHGKTLFFAKGCNQCHCVY